MNELFFISTYRRGKTWLFDDVARGIVAEPFVCGASELIQKYLDRKDMKHKRKNVALVFSLQPFPDTDVILTCTEKCHPLEITGYTNSTKAGKTMRIPQYKEDFSQEPTSAYYTDQEGDKLWLCPAQIKFFGAVADTIYAKIG